MTSQIIEESPTSLRCLESCLSLYLAQEHGRRPFWKEYLEIRFTQMTKANLWILKFKQSLYLDFFLIFLRGFEVNRCTCKKKFPRKMFCTFSYWKILGKCEWKSCSVFYQFLFFVNCSLLLRVEIRRFMSQSCPSIYLRDCEHFCF